MAMKHNLVSMKLPPREDDREEMMSSPVREENDYPYGLCLHLEKEQISALNLPEMPEPGEEFKVMAMAVVTTSSMEPSGKRPHIGLQITSMQLIPSEIEMEEKEPGEKPKKPTTVLGNTYRSYD